MTKAEIVKAVHKLIGLSKTDSARLVDSFFELIKQELAQGNDILLSGFGRFDVRQKKERIGRNPKTGEEVMISARSVVTFHASSIMKQKIQEGANNE